MIGHRKEWTAMARLIPFLQEPGRAWILVLAVTLAASLAGVFTLPVLDRDEARFAQATAQMMESGDLVRIRFLDEDRHKKPVGIHWTQLLTVTAGEAVSGALTDRQIWAWRLASTLGAVLAALGAMALANRLLGPPAGLYAGVLLGASVLLGVESGIAKTDAMLAGITVWALYALARLHEADNRTGARVWAVWLWALIALGALVKGPVTPMAAGLAVTTLVIWERRMNWLRPLAFWPGPLLAAIILLPWLVSVQIATDGGFLREMLGQDVGPKLVSGHESHGGPPGYHLLALPALLFPATLFLPAGLHAAITAIRGANPQLARPARLLAVMSLPFWLAFELLPTKLPHYVLPAYPALAIFAAWGLLQWRSTPALWRWLGAGLMMAAGLFLAAVIFLPATRFGGQSVLAGALAAGFLAAVSAAVILSALHRERAAVMCALLASLAWHAAARGVIIPATDLFPSREAAALIQAEGWMTPDVTIRSSYTEPSLAFALRSDIMLMDFPALAAASVDLASEQLLVIDLSRVAADAPEAAFLDTLRAGACALDEIEGFNYSRGRATSLLIARTGDCAAIQEPDTP
ncbi:glycosyltransferase family 39 protein [Synechococcus moorigangaii CMS01]|nr:glycosyltransferase family 39 protein [Synechococcus moorigangaii CMS01]